ncbi:MAG: hypothetical protein IJK78_05995 [Bacteroidales bacterium]|jgi:hypothetical protein|nr:hypothetical protein [Bacteroidales bacterium]
MATLTIKYDGRNPIFKQVLDLFVALGGTISDEKSESSNSMMIEKIRQGREDFKNGNYKVIKTEDIWK